MLSMLLGVHPQFDSFSISLASAQNVEKAGSKKNTIKKKTGNKPIDAPVAKATTEKADQGKFAGLFASGGEEEGPLTIKSDTLQLDAKTRIFTYRGNVEAKRGDMTITSRKMIGEYDDKNQLNTLRAEDDVVIVRGDALRATSDRAFYDVAKSTVQLTQKPELINKGNALTADKITLFLNEDRSDAEGDVRVRIIKADDLAAASGKSGSASSAPLVSN